MTNKDRNNINRNELLFDSKFIKVVIYFIFSLFIPFFFIFIIYYKLRLVVIFAFIFSLFLFLISFTNQLFLKFHKIYIRDENIVFVNLFGKKQLRKIYNLYLIKEYFPIGYIYFYFKNEQRVPFVYYNNRSKKNLYKKFEYLAQLKKKIINQKKYKDNNLIVKFFFNKKRIY